MNNDIDGDLDDQVIAVALAGPVHVLHRRAIDRLSDLSRVFLMLEPADEPDLWAQWGRWRRTAAAGGEAEEKTTSDDAGTEAPCHAVEALAE
ncbi:MAG: hypothetical protein AB7X49_27490, partial [Geminicoccaceae bacterium]